MCVFYVKIVKKLNKIKNGSRGSNYFFSRRCSCNTSNKKILDKVMYCKISSLLTAYHVHCRCLVYIKASDLQ